MKRGMHCLDTCDSDECLHVRYKAITFMFFLSVMAHTQRRRSPVTTAWSRIPPARLRWAAGYVPNIPAVSGVVLCHFFE